MLRFANTVLAVSDMERSIAFYEDVLGDRVATDFGKSVVFESGLALCKAEDFEKETGLKVSFGGNAVEISFTDHDFSGFVDYLQTFSDIEYIKAPSSADSRRRSVIFFDPDRHIIEVCEEIDDMVKRLLESGLSVSEISDIHGLPLEYIRMVGKK